MIVLTITLLMISVAFNILQKLREEQYKQEVKKLNARLNQSRQKKTKQVKQVDTQQEKDIRHIMKYINVDYKKAKEIYHTNNKTS